MIQRDGRIVVVGRVWPPGAEWSILVLRYLSDGSPDPSFDGDGVLTRQVEGESFGHAALIQADGRVVFGGRTLMTGCS